MPIVQLSKEEIERQEKLEKERRDQLYKEKEKDRQLELAIAKIPSKVSRWEIFFNAPARFVAVILAYRLLKKDKEVPAWMQKFIGGK